MFRNIGRRRPSKVLEGCDEGSTQPDESAGQVSAVFTITRALSLTTMDLQLARHDPRLGQLDLSTKFAQLKKFKRVYTNHGMAG